MRGISFDYSHSFTPPDPNRMDVTCFIGFVPMRQPGVIPESLKKWLYQHGWLKRTQSGMESRSNNLLDVPVPVESWDDFQQLFAGEKRLSGKAEVSSVALNEHLSVADEDTQLTVVIDAKRQKISIGSGDDLALEDVVDAINTQLDVGVARLDVRNNARYLVISQGISDTAGRITVYANKSLGFPCAVSHEESYIDCYLAGAVRSFFAQGGRKCYVVRMGDPLPLESNEEEKVVQLARLLWGGESGIWAEMTLVDLENAYLQPMVTSNDPHYNWHGVAHLLGLTDVTFVSLPDLPDLLSAPPALLPPVPPIYGPEIFVECSPSLAEPRQLDTTGWTAPRCNKTGYRVWTRIIRYLLDFIINTSRQMQLIASVPLPDKELDQNFSPFLHNELFSGDNESVNISSAFLQLVFPWLKTRDAASLPGKVVPPEGALLGILAANALTKGAYTSVAGTLHNKAYDLLPAPFENERISVFAQSLRGIELRSDVTTSADVSYQPASISRLVALILRAAYNQGLATLFEPLSTATWKDVETTLSTVLLTIFEAGGLRGRNAKEAFDVVCDRSTMTQNDLDNGRLIAHISFQPSVPIEKINIALALEKSGRIAVQGAA